MTAADLASVKTIGESVYPLYPEDAAVLAERLRLYPDGCLVLATLERIVGYALSHPWRRTGPPPLNTLLGALPTSPDTFFIHDIALLPQARGRGFAGAAFLLLLRRAAESGLPCLSLVAIGDAFSFWSHHGFTPAPSAIEPRLLGYGDGARFMVRPLHPEQAP